MIELLQQRLASYNAADPLAEEQALLTPTIDDPACCDASRP